MKTAEPFLFTCGFCVRGACDLCPGVLSDAQRTACVCTHAPLAGPEAPSPAAGPDGAGAPTAPAPDPKAAALFLLKAKVFREWLAEEETKAKAQILAATDEGDRVTATVVMPDGSKRKVGGVTAKVASAAGNRPVVTNEAAFTAWCKEHLPHTIVEQVRGTDREVLLKEVLTYGGKMNPTDGTVTEIPGVEVVPVPAGERGLMVTAEKTASATLREAFGSLALDGAA